MIAPTQKMGILKKVMGKTQKVADAVTDVAGGTKLADYMGSKMAKVMAKPSEKPFVSDTTSGKDALKSAGSVGMMMAPIGAMGAGLRVGSAAMKAQKASKAISQVAPKFKVVKRSAGKEKVIQDLIRGQAPKAANVSKTKLPVRPTPKAPSDMSIRGINKSQFAQ